ncbi:MAG TPA: hypothetical protein ENJ35_06730 [Gammaproteobacteria bacterium]|nr:hypothetical protein [Gammaproteobacteria bacterium]
MRRHLIFIVIGVIVLLAAVVGAVYAFPSGQWVSGVTVANLSNETATVVITFYNQDGTVALEFNGGTIPPNGAKTWYLPSHVTGLPDGFIGSAVVSSDQEIAAIVNTQLPSGSNPTRVGTSTGVGNPSEVMYATQVMKDYYGWNSYCAVQNTGSSSAVVTATYYDSTGSVVDVDEVTIPAYASYLFDQSTDSELSSGFNGSAKFESDAAHPLAVVCNFYNQGTSASTSQIHSYNGMGAGGHTLYVPRVVKDYYNYQSGLKVQNIGTEPLSVTVTYNFNGHLYTQTSPDFDPGQAWGPYLGDERQLPASMAGVSGSGSAIITVNNPNPNKAIIATVNEDNRVNPAGRGVTYLAALPSEASNTLVFPQITSEYYGYSSGIQIMKVSSGTVTCTVSYAAMGHISSFEENIVLTDAQPSWSQFAPDASGMLPGHANDDYNGAVTVSCTGDVIGISNLSFRYDVDNRWGNVLGDSFTTARGINK